MYTQRQRPAFLRDWAVVILGLTAIGLAVYFIARPPNQKRHRLTITAGRASGQRHEIAEIMAKEARRAGLDARVQETAGSEEALDQVNEGKLQVALVQGGLGIGSRGNIRQVAALHVEPLHLLVKSEHFPAVSKNLAALKGKVVNLSEPGSGTHTLSLEVLRFAGLTPGRNGRSGDFIPGTLSYKSLLAQTRRDKLPDAVFMVQSLPSPVARHLITHHDFRIVPLTFAEAFSLDGLSKLGERSAADAKPAVEKSYVYDTVIPAFTYGVEPPVPAEPVHTLGTRLLVVAHKDASPQGVDRLIETMFTTPFARVSKPPLDARTLELPPEFELHAGTVDYLQRKKPLIAADLVDYSEKVVAIAATVIGGLFFLWQALRQWNHKRQQQTLKNHLLAVSNIEQRALKLESAASLDLRQLLWLQQELNQLKEQTLSKFASGELQGEQLVSSFLTLVNDTRGYLTRLILHERNNLEEQAAQEGRQATEIWLENTARNPQRITADL